MPLVRDLPSSVIALVLVGACTRAPPVETPVQSDAAVTAAIQPAPAPADATLQVPGPVAGARLTEAYARAAARDVYFWGWTQFRGQWNAEVAELERRVGRP